MRPMLDDIELPQVQEIAAYDRRMLAEHKPPGMDGSLLQNLGRQRLEHAAALGALPRKHQKTAHVTVCQGSSTRCAPLTVLSSTRRDVSGVMSPA